MLIARAPVRVSFFGGGTDLPAYYERFGGAVLSTAIDKYFYVVLGNSEGSVQVSSSDYRTFFQHTASSRRAPDDQLRLPRAVLDQFAIYEGLSIFLSSEVPPGTGLGSSSSVTVALVKALATYCGQHLPPSRVAELACEIEIDRLAQPIGKQDQYAAAFGGMNFIEFRTDSSVVVTPLALPPETLRALEEALLDFAGCAVVISHDRWFLDRIATHILAFEGDSKVLWFEGNYADYEADKHRRLGTDADQPTRIKYKKLTH